MNTQLQHTLTIKTTSKTHHNTTTPLHTQSHTEWEGRVKSTQSDHRSEEMGSDAGGAQPLSESGGNSSPAERKDCVTSQIVRREVEGK